MELTERQKAILKAIISEFMDSAQAVGSVTLSSRYDLDASPATLRAEMARLVDDGYLFKEHSSSGRVPTTLGIRYFLDEMFEEGELDRLQETEIKESIFQKRFNRIGFIKEAVRALSDLSGQTALSIIDEMVFSSGIGQLLSYPEFKDLKLLQDMLNVIESASLLISLFERGRNNRELKTLIGDEIGMDSLNKCSIVYAPFKYFRGEKGYIGVFGPRRMKYSQVIPAVKSIAEFIEQSIRGWE